MQIFNSTTVARLYENWKYFLKVRQSENTRREIFCIAEILTLR